jgi:Mn-containing catalase
MDIATEEFSHLEIAGATIQMLLGPVNGKLKNTVEINPVAKLADGRKGTKEQPIHPVLQNPQFLVLSGAGPTVTDSNGVPWIGSLVNANGDLTVDLRSDIAAESSAKVVHEYLMKFTDDPLVQKSLRFLMTREIAHSRCSRRHLLTFSRISRRESVRAIRVSLMLISTCRVAPTYVVHGIRVAVRGQQGESDVR